MKLNFRENLIHFHLIFCTADCRDKFKTISCCCSAGPFPEPRGGRPRTPVRAAPTRTAGTPPVPPDPQNLQRLGNNLAASSPFRRQKVFPHRGIWGPRWQCLRRASRQVHESRLARFAGPRGRFFRRPSASGRDSGGLIYILWAAENVSMEYFIMFWPMFGFSLQMLTDCQKSCKKIEKLTKLQVLLKSCRTFSNYVNFCRNIGNFWSNGKTFWLKCCRKNCQLL